MNAELTVQAAIPVFEDCKASQRIVSTTASAKPLTTPARAVNRNEYQPPAQQRPRTKYTRREHRGSWEPYRAAFCVEDLSDDDEHNRSAAVPRAVPHQIADDAASTVGEGEYVWSCCMSSDRNSIGCCEIPLPSPNAWNLASSESGKRG